MPDLSESDFECWYVEMRSNFNVGWRLGDAVTDSIPKIWKILQSVPRFCIIFATEIKSQVRLDE